MPLDASIPFKSTDEDENHRYQNLFDDHLEGVRVSVILIHYYG